MLRDQEKRRIVAMHRAPKHPGRVLRIARNCHIDTRVVGEGSFVRLAMPKAAAWKVGTIGSIDHKRTGPAAERTPAQVAEIGYDLVPGRPDGIDELQLKHWPFPVRRKPA